MGTSVRMIERHYGALLDEAHAWIAGRLMRAGPNCKPPENGSRVAARLGQCSGMTLDDVNPDRPGAAIVFGGLSVSTAYGRG